MNPATTREGSSGLRSLYCFLILSSCWGLMNSQPAGMVKDQDLVSEATSCWAAARAARSVMQTAITPRKRAVFMDVPSMRVSHHGNESAGPCKTRWGLDYASRAIFIDLWDMGGANPSPRRRR